MAFYKKIETVKSQDNRTVLENQIVIKSLLVKVGGEQNVRIRAPFCPLETHISVSKDSPESL